MTVREALRAGAGLLVDSETPFLDAGLLLASVMTISRDKLLASYPESISEETYTSFMTLIERRRKGIPVSYILNRKEFYGRTFYVDERVLVPRPDTEILVGTAIRVIERFRKEIQSSNGLSLIRLADVCTGTGCIPITIALETAGSETGLEITAGELSEAAMEVFRINMKNLNAPKIELIKSDLLTGFMGKYHIITSNPPYITSSETAGMMGIGWPEPSMALDGGEDGLDYVRKLVVQSRDKLVERGYLLMEAAWNQMEAISSLMEKAGYSDIEIIRDLADRNRVIKGRLFKS